jgi:hypothetical protein
VLAQRLVVVFAKSGMGKSSLINAGLKEMLWEKGLLPLPVRVNDRDAGPFTTVYEGIEQAARDRAVDFTPGSRLTLWHYFKTAEFWRGDLLLTPVLILDQFEELFTLQAPEQREPFVSQLGDLVRGVRPSVADADRGARQLTHAPPDVRVLIALREDYLGQLEEMSEAIPQILDKRFRLGPLLEKEARQAIEEPARLEDPRLETEPFAYADDALEGIWAILSRRLPGQVVESKPYVEPFQLQLVCQRAEEIALELQQARSDGEPAKEAASEVQHARRGERMTVTWEALGKETGLQRTLASFYERQVAAFPSERARRAVRRLCEYGLISVGGRRLSLEEGEIERTYRVKRNTLKRLVELRLLRADTRVGSVYYELSHDTLVDPIFAARRRREARTRVVRNTLAVVLVVGIVGPVAVSWLTHEWLRRSLARDLGWTRISAPTTRQFMMGCVPGQCDPGEMRHEAPLERSFELMTHEVTVEQFRRFRAEAGSTMVGRWRLPRDVIMEAQPDWNKDNHPVVRVSWYDASAFCEFVGGRLPTEAEWEYAARGGNADSIYPWGNDFSRDRANGPGTGGSDMWEWSAPVGSFPPNGYGLFDMIGNVWEWTSSVYRQYPYKATDGREDSASREARVVRGGSFVSSTRLLRVSNRDFFSPANRLNFLGFRCARDGSP